MPPIPDSSDGKDFLEQLRTIHFSLAVICLTTVIVVNLPESTKFSRAADDLDKVVKIAQSPSWEKQLVVEAAKSVARGHKECQPVDAPSEGRPAAANFATTSPLGPLRIEIDRMWDLDFADLPVTLDDTLLPVLKAPQTLGEFQKIWDFEGELLCPAGAVEVEKGAKLAVIHRTDWSFSELSTMISLDASKGRVPRKFMFIGKKRFDKWPATLLMQVPEPGDDWPLAIRVSVTSYPVFVEKVRLRRGLINKLFVGYADDPFANVFPGLLSTSAGRETMLFQNLANYLRAQETSRKDVFEAFGIKFPIDSAARWAIIMIFATQAYFWIHLKEYYRRRFPTSSVAWIGAYPSWAAKALSAVTFLLAPAAVSIYLGVRQRLAPLRFTHDIFGAISVAAVLISITLSVVTGVAYWRGTRSDSYRPTRLSSPDNKDKS